MKNGRWAIFAAVLLCLPLWLGRATSDGLLNDSDTRFLLMKLGEYKDPFRWFTNDWPLENHFYRPISTLFFELDLRLHGSSAAGYGATNALLCIACALAVFWLGWELFRSSAKALLMQGLFVWWVAGRSIPLLDLAPYLCLIVVFLSAIRFRTVRKDQIFAIGAAFFLPTLLSPISSKLSNDTLLWLPGRTATSMGLFCLIAMASYLRFERQSGEKLPALAPSATDVPATRTTKIHETVRGGSGWFAMSLFASALAMGAYEQAVMIPFVIFLLGFWLRTERIQARFSLQMGYWVVLFGYIAVRLSVIPIQPSRYQSQQFRSGIGWMFDVMNYLFPGANVLPALWGSLTVGALILLSSQFWSTLSFPLCNVSFWLTMKGSLKRAIILLFGATLAFLPMAFLNQFGHYHFWPAALMAAFCVVALEAFWKALVTAVSPQALQAPPRSSRAPGSLPHL